MPQVRIMHQDADHVNRVVALLLALIEEHGQGLLFAGAPTTLDMRGPGARVVFDLSDVSGRASSPGGRVRVDAERVDTSPARRPSTRSRRALPPGSSS